MDKHYKEVSVRAHWCQAGCNVHVCNMYIMPSLQLFAMYYDLDTIVQPLCRQVSAHKGMGTLQTNTGLSSDVSVNELML